MAPTLAGQRRPEPPDGAVVVGPSEPVDPLVAVGARRRGARRAVGESLSVVVPVAAWSPTVVPVATVAPVVDDVVVAGAGRGRPRRLGSASGSAGPAAPPVDGSSVAVAAGSVEGGSAG